MRSLIIPKLFEQKSASEFFIALVAANSHKKSFSQRSFSTKIGWPVSYLPDLIKKRKKLTIERAIQFGNFTKLSPIDFEQLIYLAIADSSPDLNSLKRIKAIRTTEERSKIDDENLMSAKTILILMATHWLKDKATEENLIKVAQTRRVSPEEVKSILRMLVEKKLFTRKKKIYVAEVNAIEGDVMGKQPNYKIWLEFMDFQKVFFENPIRPSFFSGDILIVSESRFLDIRERLMAFRNWMMEISNTDSKLTIEEDKTLLYQFDIFFTPLPSNIIDQNE